MSWINSGPAFLVAATALACGSNPAQDDLDAARARWEAEGVTSYTMVTRRLCYCGNTDSVLVEVEQGRVVSARRQLEEGGDQPIPVGERPDTLTVERHFAAIQDAIDQDADSIKSDYDPLLGYPVSVWIDYRENVADEELGLQINELTPKP